MIHSDVQIFPLRPCVKLVAEVRNLLERNIYLTVSITNCQDQK